MYLHKQLPTHNESRKRITGYDKLDNLTYIIMGFTTGVILVGLVYVTGGYISGFIYSMASQINTAVVDTNRTSLFTQKLIQIHQQAGEKTNVTKRCLK